MNRKEERAIFKRSQELCGLLDGVGLKLVGWEPGVTAMLPKDDGTYGATFSFSADEWNWLEPILKELIEARKTQKA